MELPVYSDLTSIEKELPFTLRGAGHNYVQNEIVRPFGFPVYQILLGRTGTGTVEIKGKRSVVKPDQALVLFPEEPHRYAPDGDEWVISWISFHGFQLADLFFKVQVRGSGVYTVKNPAQLDENIERAVNLLSDPRVENKLRGSALVYAVILECYYQLGRVKDALDETSPKVLEPALRIILNEYHRSIPLDELADACDITPQHLIRLFRSTFQQKPTSYINTVRIDKSKELLRRFPEMKIGDIARLCGFKSESYFSSVFKRFETMKPRDYRTQQ